MVTTFPSGQLIVGFTDPGSDDPPLVGGTGANLGRPVAAGLTVPDGFTATTRTCP